MTRNIHENVKTDFSPEVSWPSIDPTAYVHPLAAVIGAVNLGKRVMVAPGASVRGDEGQSIFVDDEANVQDGVVLHALETWSDGEEVAGNLVEVNGEKYAVHVGKRVSLAHQVQIHGPARVGDDSFIGMQSLVFKSEVGERCVVEPKSLLLGVKVASGRYVPAGTVLTSQDAADELPLITTDYPFRNLNKGVVHVNTHLADAYNREMPIASGDGIDELIQAAVRDNISEMIRSIVQESDLVKKALTKRTLEILGATAPGATLPAAKQPIAAQGPAMPIAAAQPQVSRSPVSPAIARSEAG